MLLLLEGGPATGVTWDAGFSLSELLALCADVFVGWDGTTRGSSPSPGLGLGPQAQQEGALKIGATVFTLMGLYCWIGVQ